MVVEVYIARLRHREKQYANGLPPSMTEGGASNFSPMKWFGMQGAIQDGATAENGYIARTHQVPTSAGALQYGTAKDFGDDEDHLPMVIEPSPPPSSQPLALASMTTAPSQVSLQYAQSGYAQPADYAAQPMHQPRPAARTDSFTDGYAMPPLRRSDTMDYGPLMSRDAFPNQMGSAGFVPVARAETFQEPALHSYGPLRRAESFQSSGIRRAGSMPLQAYQPVGQTPMRTAHPRSRSNTLQQSASYADLYDPMNRPVRRTATDNVSYMQSDRPHPFSLAGHARTNSFPYNMEGPHTRSRSDSPSRRTTPPRQITPPPMTAAYPDVRFLRPDLHPPRQQVPYPDNHPERVFYPGDRSYHESRAPDRSLEPGYPNYEYDGSNYGQR